MSQPRASCQITIRGSFDLNWADYVGDMLTTDRSIGLPWNTPHASRSGLSRVGL